MDLFTVDRNRSLFEGQVCTLKQYSDMELLDYSTHAYNLFPDGVSFHGQRHFLDANAQITEKNNALELLFEQVRRSAFPERPSRLQSMFAVETLCDAKKFCSDYGAGLIYKVKAGVVFRADMNLLCWEGSVLTMLWRAHRYWKGEAGMEKPPRWEWLLKCPVKICEQVI